MNKRIQQLAEQATTYIEPVPGHSGEGWIFDKEKFAELIVRECVLISRTSTDGFSAGRRMEEHFGVKE